MASPRGSALEEFRLAQERGRAALEKERQMRQGGEYPSQRTLQSLGVFSEPSSFGVGTRESPAEYDPTFLVCLKLSSFCSKRFPI